MNALTGTWPLLRLALRRDRVVFPLWTLILGLFPYLVASSFQELVANDAEREQFARSMSDPALTAVYGPLFGDSVGALTAWRSGIVLLLTGLAAAFTVIRHTRAEEEQGRRELLGATVVGRQAGLAAGLGMATLGALVVGLVITLTMSSVAGGAGAVALGLEYAVACLFFGAVAAVAAQLTEGARAARWITGAIVIGSMLMRVAGDAGGNLDSPLSWASPIGLLQRVRPYAGERFWILPIVFAAAIVLAGVAYRLSASRDLGAGLVASRPGPARAPRSLSSALGLAWRLQRGTLVGWLIGFAVMGLLIGSVANAALEAAESNPELTDVLRRLGGDLSVGDLMLAATASIMGIGAAAQGVQAALRARSEESEFRAEPVLAGAVSRLRWAGGHALLAFAGPALSLVVAGVCAGLSFGTAQGDIGGQLPRTLGATLVQLPAVWLTTAIVVALFGLAPRLTGLGWGVLAFFLLLGQLGAVLQLSQWALDLSPFTHLPHLPGGDVTAAPLVWLLAIAAVLTALGLAGFRRRDVKTA